MEFFWGGGGWGGGCVVFFGGGWGRSVERRGRGGKKGRESKQTRKQGLDSVCFFLLVFFFVTCRFVWHWFTLVVVETRGMYPGSPRGGCQMLRPQKYNIQYNTHIYTKQGGPPFDT